MSGLDAPIKRVLTLLYTNLAISILITILTFAMWRNVIDFQLAHIAAANPSNPDAAEQSRQAITIVSAVVPIVVLCVSLLYVRIAGHLRQGKRRTYVRLLVIAIVGIVGLAFPTISTQYPLWMRIGHAAQELVLIGLFLAVTRSSFRSRFTKSGSQTSAGV